MVSVPLSPSQQLEREKLKSKQEISCYRKAAAPSPQKKNKEKPWHPKEMVITNGLKKKYNNARLG
jgi:hypothetical protein